MAHVIPARRARVKLAALQQADALGRARAHLHVNTRMAKQAGAVLARGLVEKRAGRVFTLEEIEMLKEAGLFSRVGGWLSKKVPKLLKRAPKKPTSVLTKMKGAPQIQKGTIRAVKGGPPATPYRKPAPPTTTAAPSKPRRGRVPSRAEMEQGWGAGTKKTMQEVPGMPGVRKQVRTAPSGAAQAQEISVAKAKAAPTREQLAKTEIRGAAGQAPSRPQQLAPPEPKKRGLFGIGYGRALGAGALGLTGYGLYKGVPWAMRQMEQASTTPMAYGGSYGWSPVPYGYGYTPYGSGTPTMGGGA